MLANMLVAQTNYLKQARNTSNNDLAIYYTEKHLQVVIPQRNIPEINTGYRFLIVFLTTANNPSKQIAVLNQLKALALKINDNRLLANYYYLKGNVEKSKQNYSAALDLSYKAYDLCIKVQKSDGIVRTALEVLDIYRIIGKHNDATPFINKAEAVINSGALETNQRLIAWFYNRLAAFKNESSEHRQSIFYSKKSIALNEKTGHKEHIATSWNEIGFSYKNLNIMDSANNCYIKAEQLFRELNNDEQLLHTMNNRAMLYAHNHVAFAQTAALYFEIIHLVQSKKIEVDLSETYNYLKNEYYKQHDYANAYKYGILYHDAFFKNEERFKNIAIEEVKEKHESIKAKENVLKVSEQLKQTEFIVKQQKTQNKLIVGFVAILFTFLLLLLYLRYKLKQTNQVLNNKNKEKDALIQEIHHRVKNNLQLVR